jgi:tetratricopeptide (TPR) repeat protein
VADYERNTRAIALLAAERGVPLILTTAPANLADWPPVHRWLRDDAYQRGVAEIQAQIARGDLAAAEAALAGLAAAYPGDAMVAFLGGRLALARGEWSRARAAFDVARDGDPMPWRALGRFNDHLRRIAQRDGVFLADLDAAFRRTARRGMVGFDLVADNCHPTPLGSALIARELLQVMAEHRLGIDSLEGLPELAPQRDRFLAEAHRARPDAELAYLGANGRFAMKWPFTLFDVSAAYFERALAIAPDDETAWANLATLAILEGRTEEGRVRLERATALRGGALDRWDRNATPYLPEALALLNGEIAQFAPPQPH